MDIKSLYNAAKTRGWNSDISAYVEAVNTLLNSNPNNYVTNLEYIVSSSPGAESFLEFVERYGLCLGLYNEAKELVEEAIHKCERDGKPAGAFEKVKEWLESFYTDHYNEFAMYEWYCDELDESYIDTYYGFNKNGIQNRNLVNGMIKKFGEAAVPDMIITAKNIDENALKNTTEFIESYDMFETPIFFEYLNTICDISDASKARTASHIVNNMRIRNKGVFRESVITGNMNNEYSYSREELAALKDLISFKEYQILRSEYTGIPMQETANEIFSLYEEYEGMNYMESDEVNNKEDDLVPIFCLLRHYSNDEDLPDSVKENENFKRSVNLCNTINKVSGGDQYSHAVLGFDEECKEMYSFESMGIVKDSWDSEYWSYTTSIYMSVMFIPKADKERMHKLCKDYADAPQTTNYAYSDLIHLFLGTKTPKKDRRFLCSSFTSFVLAVSNPKNIHKDYSGMRPEDITILPRAFYVINVKNAEDFAAHRQVIHDKVAAIKAEHMDELEDYNNNLPKILLQDTMRKEKTLDKILDSVMGSKLNPRMQEENEDGKEEEEND